MKPYYEDDRVTLYCGDCREILPTVAADVLVTDPPFGVGLGSSRDRRGAGQGHGRGDSHGLVKRGYRGFTDDYPHYVEVVVPALTAAVAQTKRGAVFTGPHFQELPKATALGGVFFPAGAGRHAWGFKTFLPVLFYGSDPLLHRGARPNVIVSGALAEANGHPCPKPVEWMRWLIGLVSLPDEVVLDPFAGSGTTLRAAKDLGRRAIGIEIDPAYCEIAVRRLAQQVLPLEVA